MIELAHIHPMLVHFPLALLPLSVAALLVAQVRDGTPFGRSCWARSGTLLLVLAALGALAAAAFGDMALDIAVQHGTPLAKLEDHEELGMTSAWLMAALAALQLWFFARRGQSRTLGWLLVLGGVAILATTLTAAWFGGDLVYHLGVNVGA
jgi:uncharacterized membrane protein